MLEIPISHIYSRDAGPSLRPFKKPMASNTRNAQLRAKKAAMELD
jgi:hypothetical protein